MIAKYLGVCATSAVLALGVAGSASSAASAGTAVQKTVGFDVMYDNPGTSFRYLACSDGSNGFITRGYETLGEVESFPNVVAIDEIAGWNSSYCGATVRISYGGRTITAVAVDHADNGALLSKAAMNTLTNGRADELGTVKATVEVTPR
ncbi:hypothetical protein ACIBKX_33900 [Streptomyces sp. NPDC050658]|uniref:hypothetical protein n=1 Tax=unclassified Streptomyces TaxID=2593676 RepID=UPI00341F0DA4